MTGSIQTSTEKFQWWSFEGNIKRKKKNIFESSNVLEEKSNFFPDMLSNPKLTFGFACFWIIKNTLNF